jgi:hypothetical protein
MLVVELSVLGLLLLVVLTLLAVLIQQIKR